MFDIIKIVVLIGLVYVCSLSYVVGKSQYCENTENFYTNYVDSDAVPNPDAHLAILQKDLAVATENGEKNQLRNQISDILQARCKTAELVDELTHEFAGGDEEKIKRVKGVSAVSDEKTIGCHKQIMKTFIHNCLKTKPDVYQVQTITNLTKFCHVDYVSWKPFVGAIKNKCSS